MTRLATACALALLLAPPAFATDAPRAAKRAAIVRVTGFPAPKPIFRLTLGRGQNTAITHPKKIVKAVSGDPAIVEVARFQKAQPTIGLRTGRPGVTNVLVWTSDAQVHTYRVTVK